MIGERLLIDFNMSAGVEEQDRRRLASALLRSCPCADRTDARLRPLRQIQVNRWTVVIKPLLGQRL
jgi:hypothetical protein